MNTSSVRLVFIGVIGLSWLNIPCAKTEELKARISGREEMVHQCPTHNSGTVVTTYTLLFQISHDILSSVFVAEHLLSQSYL